MALNPREPGLRGGESERPHRGWSFAALLALLLCATSAQAAGQASASEGSAPPPPDSVDMPPRGDDAGADAAGAKAAGEAPPPEDGAAAEAGGVPGELVAPVPLGALEVPLPPDAPPLEGTVDVRVLLRIDEEGAVTGVELLEGAGAPWDGAVLEAARAFRFRPATLDGQPVEVEIPFLQRFVSPPTLEEATPAVLEGVVVEKGTRRPIPGALVEVQSDEGAWQGQSDEAGRFSVEAGEGSARVVVVAPGHRRFTVRERLVAGERLDVRYLVERQTYDPYETVVVGKAQRVEVSRTSLSQREIQRVPGTFGDPFRVVETLPGVTQMMSLVSYPVVRGSNPGTTGFLIDGIRVPQLFHYLAGPAVLHPTFLERIDFYPGNFPHEYGGYTGGIVDGITRGGRPDERTLDLGLDLLNASLFLREPTAVGSLSAAGRYGYPGLLLGTLTQGETTASYWDYQARLDGGRSREGFTVFAFGSHDEFQSREEIGGTQFHRLDLRYRTASGGGQDLYRITFGFDRTFSREVSFDSWSVEPRARWERPLSRRLSLRMGLDTSWRRSAADTVVDDESGLRLDSSLVLAGLFFDTPFWLTKDLLVTPGLRIDAYDGAGARQVALDPRLSARYRLMERQEAQLWLKAGVGMFHQPPRFFIPVPGLDELSLDMGLPGSLQSSGGAELELASGWAFDGQLFFNHMGPILLEPSLLQGFQMDPEDDPVDLLKPKTGRAYGIELLVRKRNIGPLFGWLSYTLSRSERRDGAGWIPYDFDRPHIVNAVAGLRLPRDWELGARFQVQAGRPVRSREGETRRLAPFTRLDLRVDRRVVYKEWMLDFYVDVINVMVSEEPLGDEGGQPLRYLLPTIGFRAVL